MDIFCKLGFLEVTCPKAKVDACVKTTLIIHPTSKTKISKLFWIAFDHYAHMKNKINAMFFKWIFLNK
jgi:hypothetical protein